MLVAVLVVLAAVWRRKPKAKVLVHSDVAATVDALKVWQAAETAGLPG